MATEAEIANLAAIRLGVENVTSLSSPTNNVEETLEALFDLTRDLVLKEHSFNFSIEEVTLTSADLSGDTSFKYENVYDLPAGFLKTVEENSNEIYQVKGALILSDASTLELRYVSQVTDSTLFSPEFIHAFYLRLAHEACMSLTQDSALKAQVFAEYEDAINMARWNDSGSSSPQHYEIDDFTDVRY